MFRKAVGILAVVLLCCGVFMVVVVASYLDTPGTAIRPVLKPLALALVLNGIGGLLANIYERWYEG